MKTNILNYIRWTVGALALVAVILVLWWLLFAEKDNHVSMEIDNSIDVTPEQIASIRAIGQWEFLSISDEELVDTVRKGFFKDDQLVRIYYGTLRLGIDMSRVHIYMQSDTVTLSLPPIGLLDQNFIDEARTKAFYESGKWQPKDREALYHKARRRMLAHGLTPENLRNAQQNADEQLRRMMKTMGYQNVIIKFED